MDMRASREDEQEEEIVQRKTRKNVFHVHIHTCRPTAYINKIYDADIIFVFYVKLVYILL